MKYEVTHSCGHTETIALFGPHKSREYRISCEESKLCPDCWKKQQQEKAEQFSKENELPDLVGTEKQVAWATRIRSEMVRSMNDRFENLQSCLDNTKGDGEERTKLAETLDLELKEFACLVQETSSRYWIDNRDAFPSQLLKSKEPDAKRSPDQIAVEQEQAEIKAAEEAVAKAKRVMAEPENRESGVIVSIDVRDGCVYARNNKLEWLQDFYHTRQYVWNRDAGAYTHKTADYLGTAEDHAAELGNLLLNEGFAVEFPNAEIRDKAVNADYEPEVFRYICVRDNDPERVRIRWGNRYNFYGTTLYEKARDISGARVDKTFSEIAVPVKSYRELEEFAKLYHFIYSPAARKALDDYKATVEIVAPAAALKVDLTTDLSSMRNMETDILAKLRDED